MRCLARTWGRRRGVWTTVGLLALATVFCLLPPVGPAQAQAATLTTPYPAMTVQSGQTVSIEGLALGPTNPELISSSRHALDLSDGLDRRRSVKNLNARELKPRRDGRRESGPNRIVEGDWHRG